MTDRTAVVTHYAALSAAITHYDKARATYRAARADDLAAAAAAYLAVVRAAAQLDACLVTYRAALATYADLAGPADPMAAALADFDAHAARSNVQETGGGQ